MSLTLRTSKITAVAGAFLITRGMPSAIFMIQAIRQTTTRLAIANGLLGRLVGVLLVASWAHRDKLAHDYSSDANCTH